MTTTLDWTRLGREVRQSSLDAHGELVPVAMAYSFILDNPECFLDGGTDEWPEPMPFEPPQEFIAAYYGAI